MLYNPDRHETLLDIPWSVSGVRSTIDRIVENGVTTLDNEVRYPKHPHDEELEDWAGMSHYIGTGGVLWALDYLRKERDAAVDESWLIANLTAVAENMEAVFNKTPLAAGVPMMFGDLPIAMQLLELTGESGWRDLIAKRVEKSTTCPVQEMMWGVPGVLILSRLIRDPDLLHDVAPFDALNIEHMFDAWSHEQDGMTIWLEELYGQRAPYLGPVHGFTGQVLPLLQRLSDLTEDERDLTLSRTRDVLLKTAAREDGLANWPAAIPQPAEMVQYCHGASGVVIAMCDYPVGDADIDQVLLDAGNLIWQAGPLAKGSNLCHGTGGNGYAFLKLFERTGDEQWLDRARAFAMHGISQYEAESARVGFDRFSLWTGDIGLAIYLHDCLRAEAAFPTVDVF